jgi:hypothetical protein
VREAAVTAIRIPRASSILDRYSEKNGTSNRSVCQSVLDRKKFDIEMFEIMSGFKMIADCPF